MKLHKAEIGDILQHKVMPTDWWGKVIDWFTLGGGYSHTALYVGDNVKAEAIAKGIFGVKEIALEELNEINVYRVKGGLTIAQKKLLQQKVMEMYGVKYDYLGLISTLRSSIGSLLNWNWLRKSRPILNEKDKWFCSEIVSHIYLDALGIDIVPEVSCYVTTPNDIGRSSVLERIEG